MVVTSLESVVVVRISAKRLMATLKVADKALLLLLNNMGDNESFMRIFRCAFLQKTVSQFFLASRVNVNKQIQQN